MSASATRLQPHFASLEQQAHAARLGTWLLLASELLLFGALFALYSGCRAAHAEVFREAVRHTDFALGAAMTVVLITSSLCAALAVGAARGDRLRVSSRWLSGAVALGFVFLILKGAEYRDHFREGLVPGTASLAPALPDPAANLFFTLYYFMTGLHALHVIAGMIWLGVAGAAARGGRYDAAYHTPLELGALYWHLVDVIWIFLWPTFYLLR